MDRVTTYADAIPLETDVLRTNQYAMVGIAKLSEAVLGFPTSVSGFPLTPSSPASLSVILGPGHVYEQENLEATAWSSLPADTHTIVKQGILLDPATLTITPPTTVGYSQAFLVEVQYIDADILPVVIPYFNAANPDVQFNGPGGDGASQSTARRGSVAYQIKAGVAATSGFQAVPTPDAGWSGLYVVTVAFGQTTITAGNITNYAGAPFIPVTLPNVPLGVQTGFWLYSADQGALGALIAPLSPPPAALTIGMEIHVKALNAANGADTINVAGLGVLAIKRRAGATPVANDWAAGDIIGLRYTGSAWQITGLVSSDVLAIISAGIVGHSSRVFTTSGTWVVPAGIYYVRADIWGPGAGGGGMGNSGPGGGGGGGAGGDGWGWYPVTPGNTLTITVGAPGTGGAAGGNNGTSGGTTTITGFNGGLSLTVTGGIGGTGYTVGTGGGGAGGVPSGQQDGTVGGSGQNGIQVGSVYLGGQGGGISGGGGPSFNAAANGQTGSFPGGGGGGGFQNYPGGNGGGSKLLLTW